MADIQRNNINREAPVKRTGKKRKKKLRLKKSVRLTLAALLMVTALIVALIPVQGNGVKAIAEFKVPETIDEVLNVDEWGPGHGHGVDFLDDDTKVTNILDPLEFSYPLKDNDMFRNPIKPISGNEICYREIDMTYMTDKTKPVPFFLVGKSPASAGAAETYSIQKYLGVPGSGAGPNNGNMIFNNELINENSDLNDFPTGNPGDSYVYYDKLPPTSSTGTVTQYEEILLENTMNLPEGVTSDNTHTYKYIQLRTRELTYTYDTETGTMIEPDYNNVPWSAPVYVVKSDGSQFKQARNIGTIADEAFKNIQNIESVTIPDEVNKIGNSAFENCSNLKEVSIGSNCFSIGRKAFAGCASLTNVNFSQNGSNLELIGNGAFAGIGATDFTIPRCALQTIGSGAFFRSNISNFDISNATQDGVKVGCYAFAGCPIEHITLNHVTKILSHSADGDEIWDPANAGAGSDYKAEYSQCGIFTRLPDQTITLSTATFPEYNTKLPYGTFAGQNDITYVRFDKPEAQCYDWKTQKEQMEPADEFYDTQDGFYIFGPNPSKGPKAYLYAAQNGITYGYLNSQGVLTYELTKNGYKYTFEVLSDSDCRVVRVEPSALVTPEEELKIPSKIAQYTVQEIGKEALADLSDPRIISIPDSIGTIGDKAFKHLPNLEKVEWYRGDDMPAQISIGNEAFADNNKLTRIDFRDDNHLLEYANDPDIIYIGNDAFKTGSDYLEMKGKMEVGYPPYDFAIDPLNRFNPSLNNGFIQYETGNPENLKCIYDPTIQNSDGTVGAVTLVSYPTVDTVITEENEDPVLDIGNLLEMADADLSPVEKQIINSFKSIYVPSGITSIEKAKGEGSTNQYFRDLEGTINITLTDVKDLPDNAFASLRHAAGGTKLNDIIPSSLQNVTFLSDVENLGKIPFANSKYVNNVIFGAEGTIETATVDNPFYFFEDGIIYASTGRSDDDVDQISIEECLPSTGTNGTSTEVIPRGDVVSIKDAAFQNCDEIKSVDLSGLSLLRTIPDYCFYDADKLSEVVLPDDCDSIGGLSFSVEEGNDSAAESLIDVYIPDREVYIDETAFKHDTNATIHSYRDSAAERFHLAHPLNTSFKEIAASVTATFIDYDGTIISVERIEAGQIPDGPQDPTRAGYTFTGWKPDAKQKLIKDTIFVAQYIDNSKTSSSGKGGSSGTGGGGGGGGGGGSSSGSSTNSSSNRSSTSGSSSMVGPVIVSGAPAPYSGTVNPLTAPGATGNKGNGNNVTTGNTTVTSSVKGIPNNGKMSATVNGSSDNYIIKITDTPEATAMAQAALTQEFGNLDGIKYVPFDISLYTADGQQKISPVPEGVTVSITMPIPDDLTIYGGNAKVGSTQGGSLEKIQPRFTVIDGVPCMNFTATHFSPYVVYVDTNNLTEAGIQDATPKTGDPIHPKWFLCIGLAAISILLFLKKDKTNRKPETV